MASSWDCASALSPQSGKVAAKSNHLVTLRRCEEERRPLEDSAARENKLQDPGSPNKSLDLTFTKGHSPIQRSILGRCFRCFGNAIVSISYQQLRFHLCAGWVANVAEDVKQAAWWQRWQLILGLHVCPRWRLCSEWIMAWVCRSVEMSISESPVRLGQPAKCLNFSEEVSLIKCQINSHVIQHL